MTGAVTDTVTVTLENVVFVGVWGSATATTVGSVSLR